MNIFKIALPGSSIRNSELKDEVIDSRYSSPKVNTITDTPHAGIISVDWSTTGLTFSRNTIKILDSFLHGYDYVPTAMGSFKFDNGTNKVTGILPIQIGALGIINVDTDQTNFNLKYVSLDGGSPLTIIPPFLLQVRYYIMAERGYE